MAGILLTWGKVLTGIIFLVASIFKIFSFSAFRIYLHDSILSISSFNINQDSITIWCLGFLIVTLELVLGTLLIVNIKNIFVLALGLFLIIIFILVNVFSYLYSPGSSCACFGDKIKLPTIEMLLIDFFMLVVLLSNLNKSTSTKFEEINE